MPGAAHRVCALLLHLLQQLLEEVFRAPPEDADFRIVEVAPGYVMAV